MDTKALRQKILDLAIRGKLVPQDPNDEPASVLLERIREQKQQMVKEGKLKKKDIKNDSVIFVGEDNLHYEKFADGSVKCIEDEIPFELPEGWCWSRLVSLTAIITKGASPKWQGVDYTSSGTMFITSENVGVETLLLESPKFLPEKINEIQPRSILETHDILTNIVGASIGRTCEYTLVDSANTNQAVAIIRLIAIDMVSYVVKCLNSDYCVNLMFANQVNVARANLSLSSLANFLIPIPPLKEMYRIIAHLDCSLRHISGIQSSEDELRQLILFTKTKILDLAIRGKLVPQDPNDEPASVLLERIRAEKEELIKQGKIKRDKKESVIFKGEDNSYYVRQDTHTEAIDEQFIFELPDNWEWCSLLNIAKMELGKTLDSAKNTGINYPYLRSVNVRWNDVDLSDLKEMRFEPEELERYTVRLNDLLICEGGDVGRSCVWTDDKEILYQNALHRVRFYGECNPFYFMYYMMYYESLGIIKALCKGVTIKHLTGNVLSLIPFALPPIKEQSRIVEKLNQIFTLIDCIISN